MLVLKGPQYCGKTAFVKILAGPFYHSTGNGNIADRDTILECQGHLFVEVEELSALNRADENALKTAISREVDVITKKYEPDGQSYPRSFVLIGTTNKDEFLTDSTGNTRYWTVEVGRVDLARLIDLRDVLWAEADFLARTTSADSNELKDEEDCRRLDETNATYLNVHPWVEEVRKFVAGKEEVRTTEEVLSHVLKGDMTKADKRAKNEVADILRALGAENRRRQEGKKQVRYWKMPSELTEAKAAKVVLLRPKK
jgi:predicted P-loop ATPase